MRDIDCIVIHCSDSAFGNAALIDEWHRRRGWNGIGYHFVIKNGYDLPHSQYSENDDGRIEEGRPVELIGAHVSGHNANSIGVCLIGGRDRAGNPQFGSWLTPRQESALAALLTQFVELFPQAEIKGHCEFNPQKGCPMLDMNTLRAWFSNLCYWRATS